MAIKLDKPRVVDNRFFMFLVGGMLLGMMVYGAVSLNPGQSSKTRDYPLAAEWKYNDSKEKAAGDALRSRVRHFMQVNTNAGPVAPQDKSVVVQAVRGDQIGRHAIDEGFTPSTSEYMEQLRLMLRASNFIRLNEKSHADFLKKHELSKDDLRQSIERKLARMYRQRAMNRTLSASKSELNELYRAMNDKYTVLYKIYSAETYAGTAPEPTDEQIEATYAEMKKKPRGIHGQADGTAKNPFKIAALIAFADYAKALEALNFTLETLETADADLTPEAEDRDKERIKQWVALPLYAERDSNGNIRATVRYAADYDLGYLKPEPPRAPLAPTPLSEQPTQEEIDRHTAQDERYKAELTSYNQEKAAYEAKLNALLDIDDLVDQLYFKEMEKRKLLRDEQETKVATLLKDNPLDPDGFPIYGYKHAADYGLAQTDDEAKWKELLPASVIISREVEMQNKQRSRDLARQTIQTLIKNASDALNAAKDELALLPEPTGVENETVRLANRRTNMARRAEFVQTWFSSNKQHYPLIGLMRTDLMSYADAMALMTSGSPAEFSETATKTGVVREIISDRNLRPEGSPDVEPRPNWTSAFNGFSRSPKMMGADSAWTYMIADIENEAAFEPTYYRSRDDLKDEIIQAFKRDQAPALAKQQASADYAAIIDEKAPLNQDECYVFTESLGVRLAEDVEMKLREMGVNPNGASPIKSVYYGMGDLPAETFEQKALRALFTLRPQAKAGDLIEPFEIEHHFTGLRKIASGDRHVVLAYIARRESREDYARRLDADLTIDEGYYMQEDREWGIGGVMNAAAFAGRTGNAETAPFVSFFWPSLSHAVKRYRESGVGSEKTDMLKTLLEAASDQMPLRFVAYQFAQYDEKYRSLSPEYTSPAAILYNDAVTDVSNDWDNYFHSRIDAQVVD
ncbi:MAG: hypothetical protein ABIH86_04650 [Planctomycetota bacterium]